MYSKKKYFMFYSNILTLVIKNLFFYLSCFVLVYIVYINSNLFSPYFVVALLLLLSLYKQNKLNLSMLLNFSVFLTPIYIFDLLYSNIYVLGFKLPIITLIFSFCYIVLFFLKVFILRTLRINIFKYEI